MLIQNRFSQTRKSWTRAYKPSTKTNSSLNTYKESRYESSWTNNKERRLHRWCGCLANCPLPDYLLQDLRHTQLLAIEVEILPHFPNWVALPHRSWNSNRLSLSPRWRLPENPNILRERERERRGGGGDSVSGWTAPRTAPGLQTIRSVMGLSDLRWDVANPWSDGLSKADMMSWDSKHPWIPCGCDQSLSRIRVCVVISMQISVVFVRDV
jgi:hypothetical protein